MARTWNERRFGFMSVVDSNEELKNLEGNSTRSSSPSGIQNFHRVVTPSPRGNFIRSTPPPSGKQNVFRPSTPNSVSRGILKKGRGTELCSWTYSSITCILDLFVHLIIYADALLIVRIFKRKICLVTFLLFILLLMCKTYYHPPVDSLYHMGNKLFKSSDDQNVKGNLVRDSTGKELTSEEIDGQSKQLWIEMEKKFHIMLERKWQELSRQMEMKWEQNMERMKALQKKHFDQIRDLTFGSKTIAKEVAQLKLKLHSRLSNDSMNHTTTLESTRIMMIRISQVEEKCNALEDLLNHKKLCLQQADLNFQLSILAQDLQSNFTQLFHHEKVYSSGSDFNAPSLNRQEITGLIRTALNRYDSDKTGLVDYALESAGGSIINVRNTETYSHGTTQFTIFGVPFWRSRNSPRTVIQPQVHPGECWAMRGSHGSLIIRLFATIRPTGFSLEHIPKSLAPMGNIDSAPKDFSVMGLDSDNVEEGFLLGNYTYLDGEESLQTFYVQATQDRTFDLIELSVLSNHGNMEYTCIYRFRVHGTQ